MDKKRLIIFVPLQRYTTVLVVSQPLFREQYTTHHKPRSKRRMDKEMDSLLRLKPPRGIFHPCVVIPHPLDWQELTKEQLDVARSFYKRIGHPTIIPEHLRDDRNPGGAGVPQAKPTADLTTEDCSKGPSYDGDTKIDEEQWPFPHTKKRQRIAAAGDKIPAGSSRATTRRRERRKKAASMKAKAKGLASRSTVSKALLDLMANHPPKSLNNRAIAGEKQGLSGDGGAAAAAAAGDAGGDDDLGGGGSIAKHTQQDRPTTLRRPGIGMTTTTGGVSKTDKEKSKDVYDKQYARTTAIRYEPTASATNNVAIEYPTPSKLRRVVTYLFVGPSGSGKSRAIGQLYAEKDIYRKQPDRFWDDYDGQRVCVFDGMLSAWIDWPTMLDIMDPNKNMVHLSRRRKTRVLCRIETVIIVTTLSPHLWDKPIDIRYWDTFRQRITQTYTFTNNSLVPHIDNGYKM